MTKILTPTGWRYVNVNPQRIHDFKFFTEELNATQVDDVRSWPRDPKAVKATDHYFGVNNNTKDHQLEDTQDKSEVHKEVERHLNQPIHVNDYRSGKIKDKYGRDVRLGSALQKAKAPLTLVNKFANDSTRQGTKFSGLHVHVTRSPEGVAGQTSGTQSWASTSCKHFVKGIERGYLKHEVKHGTVVSYLKDHTGKELARATLQPHVNDKGHIAYKVTSHYGIDHAGFKDHANKVAADLSHPTGDKTGVYQMHPKVHNDLVGKYNEHMLHPHIDHDLHKIVDNELNTGKSSQRLNLALNHPNANHTHFDKAINSKNALLDHSTLSIITSHRNATADNLHKILDIQKPDAFHKQAALAHENIDHTHITKALQDNKWHVRAAAVRHHKATTDHINVGLKDEHVRVRLAAVEHRNATAEHISAGLKDEEDSVRAAAVSHPKATAEHISTGLKDRNEYIRVAAAAAAKKPDLPW